MHVWFELADEHEIGSGVQPRGTGAVCNEQSVHCVLMVEATWDSIAQIEDKGHGKNAWFCHWG